MFLVSPWCFWGSPGFFLGVPGGGERFPMVTPANTWVAMATLRFCDIRRLYGWSQGGKGRENVRGEKKKKGKKKGEKRGKKKQWGT